MERHPLDPVSLLFGLAFVGGGIWVLLTDQGRGTLDGRWVWPAVLLVAGAAILASVVANTVRGETAGDEPEPVDPTPPPSW